MQDLQKYYSRNISRKWRLLSLLLAGENSSWYVVSFVWNQFHSVTFAISLKVFFIKCLFNSLCQIRSFLMVTQSIFLQCVDTKRVQLIYPPLIFFRMLLLPWMAAASMLYNRCHISYLQRNISKSDVPVCVSSISSVHLLTSHSYCISPLSYS